MLRKFLPTLCSILTLLLTDLSATGNQEAFEKYLNYYFIETGTYRGDGVKMALNGGFEEVRTVELSETYYDMVVKLFKDNPNVKIWHGDSSQLLGEMIADIDEPATFWLDGHYSGGDTASGEFTSPILQELDHISKHPIKTHTIMIDDVRDFGTYYFCYTTLDQIVDKIYEINPNYKITFERGHVENDILVAYIE